jgi:2-hydroxyacyl-CoA lyase 1
MTNCISGLANAWVNGWPMLCIAGSSDLNQTEKMAFQEMDQVQAAKPYCKFATQIKQIQLIPFLVEKAVRMSLAGKPGPVFLDLPGDVLLF